MSRATPFVSYRIGGASPDAIAAKAGSYPMM
ncbi:hypothetical protein ACVW0A_000420 [Pseudomonas sp. TE3610]